MNRKVFNCINGKCYSALATSCLFCESCSDIFVDSTGPYLCICTKRLDTDLGAQGLCSDFKEEEDKNV